MSEIIFENFCLNIGFEKSRLKKPLYYFEKKAVYFVALVLTLISIFAYTFYFSNNLAIAYNDARSHLDIGRRVVEGLKPGLAQLGSVWLPLPHFLMIPTIWSDFMWHSGLSGAIQSMVSYVLTGVLIYLYLEKLRVGMLGRLFGVMVFASNINIVYLQSTAMTELLLLATMTAAVYFLLNWLDDQKIVNLIKSAFSVMLSTLVRYDGWFLLAMIVIISFFYILRKEGYKKAEGVLVLFTTLGGLGIILWLLWNLLIFNDPLFFVFGPFSAHAQQAQLEAAGELYTKGDLYLSLKSYLYAYIYNSYALGYLAIIGAVLFYSDKRVKPEIKIGSLALIAPFLFNVLALYLGHSVLFVPGIVGKTWFNVRYGVMLLPSVAIFSGYIVKRLENLKGLIIGLFILISIFAYLNHDAVTIDDARFGSSQKNVSEVSSWLYKNAKDKDGFVLISAASHDAIIFSSRLPMKRFIHEGTGDYWENAVENPDLYARWVVMRTHDENDMTFREIKDAPGLEKFRLVESYPFADIYELKPEYLGYLVTDTRFFSDAKVKK